MTTEDDFAKCFAEHLLADHFIQQAIESGYYLRDWVDPFSQRTWKTVSDKMYGSKSFSSSFEITDFVKYINGKFQFPELPPFVTYKAKSDADVYEIISDPRRQHYQAEGSYTFRGQPEEYKFKRRIPNPVRSDRAGFEISVMAGLYRQKGEFYSFNEPLQEQRSFEWFIRELEPDATHEFFGSNYFFDIMRVEQHYATQTAGLDLAFDIETALFFATHRFKLDRDKAYYQRVMSGDHIGVIYCFRFRDPPVKKTQYLINEFDLFKTYPPERVLRQTCGLPLFMEEERNIAITDLDCIIYLEPDFDHSYRLTPEYMFPSVADDKFYAKVLELKDRKPELLKNIVEYQWARPR